MKSESGQFTGVCFHLVCEVILKQLYLLEREIKLFPCSSRMVFARMAGSGSSSDEESHRGSPRQCGLVTLKAVCDIIHSVKSFEHDQIFVFVVCFNVCFKPV